MGNTVENSIEIDRPVAEVFAFVADYRNTSRYVVGMVDYNALTDQVTGVGAQFRFVKKTTGAPDVRSDIEITDWQQDKKITLRSVGGFENGATWTFLARGEKTVVRLSNTFDLAKALGYGKGGFVRGLAGAAGGVVNKIAELQVRKDLTTSLEKMRALIEAQPRPGAGAKSGARPKAGAPKVPTKKAPAKKPAAKKTAAGR